MADAAENLRRSFIGPYPIEDAGPFVPAGLRAVMGFWYITPTTDRFFFWRPVEPEAPSNVTFAKDARASSSWQPDGRANTDWKKSPDVSEEK